MSNLATVENTVIEDERQQVITFNTASQDIAQVNVLLERMTPLERVEWSLTNLPGEHILSSSFGAQSAVMIHLLNQVAPGIPVVLTDTGHLFPQTYQFIDTLTEKLNINLQVYRAPINAAWQEARFGKLWEQGLEGIEKYNQLNKVIPMKAALSELGAKTWFAGLRRSQSDSRKALSVLQKQTSQFKVHPIVDQSNRDLYLYMKAHQLPYHPLWEQGYVSIGDWHTTSKLEDGMTEEQTRFFGLKRECGLHEFGDGDGI
ncbi:MAG: phosphoadenosine phosphosulfate reductase [Glaciecola sp.]|jgi:phosphoadenosine phosphosulfate reductase